METIYACSIPSVPLFSNASALHNTRHGVNIRLTPRPVQVPPIPPGDDSWDREGDLPPQPFDIWTRTNVGENLPFPITPLTATYFPRIFALDATSAQQPAPAYQATKRLYGRLYINEGAIVHEQKAITIRDNSRNAMTKFIFPMRILFAQLGQRWTEKGWLRQPDDIHFLIVTEVAALVENGLSSTLEALQERVDQRRTAYEYWFSVVPPDAIDADGQPLSRKAATCARSAEHRPAAARCEAERVLSWT